MQVPFANFGRMSKPCVNKSLIDALSSAIACEGMAQDVPTAKHIPFRMTQRSLEMIVDLVAGKWRCGCSLRLRSHDLLGLGEKMLSARVNGKPFLQNAPKKRGQRHPAGRSFVV